MNNIILHSNFYKPIKIVIVVLLLCCFCNISQAQIKYFNVESVNNKNQQLVTSCADVDASVIIVMSSSDGLSFKSSYDGILSQKYNDAAKRYIICIKNIKQTITIQKNGFMEDKIKISNTPEPKSVFYYNVSEKQSVINVVLGEFTLNTIPVGANIKIVGIPSFNEKTPYSFKDYEAKVYRISLTLVDFDKIDTIIEIRKEKNQQQKVFELVSAIGYLNFSIVHKDTKISINGVEINNVHGELYKTQKGKNKIKISASHYKSFETEINVLVSKIHDVNCKLEPKMGTITLNLQNDKGKAIEADFILDNNKISEKQLKNFSLQEGSHKLIIKKDNFVTINKQFEIKENSETKLEVNITNLVEVSISSDPSNSSFKINNNITGSTPQKIKVPIGNNSIVLNNSQFVDTKEAFQINENSTSLSFRLKPDEFLNAKSVYIKNSVGFYSSLFVVIGGLAITGFESYNIYAKFKKYKTATTEATQLHNDVTFGKKILFASLGTAAIAYIPFKFFKRNHSSFKRRYKSFACVPYNNGVLMTMNVNF